MWSLGGNLPTCTCLFLTHSFPSGCVPVRVGHLRRTHRPCHQCAHGLVGIKKAGLCVSVKQAVGADEVPCEAAGGGGGIPVRTGLPVSRCMNSCRQHWLGSQYVLTLVVQSWGCHLGFKAWQSGWRCLCPPGMHCARCQGSKHRGGRNNIRQGRKCRVGWEDLRAVATRVSWTLKDTQVGCHEEGRREGHCRWTEWHERAG